MVDLIEMKHAFSLKHHSSFLVHTYIALDALVKDNNSLPERAVEWIKDLLEGRSRRLLLIKNAPSSLKEVNFSLLTVS